MSATTPTTSAGASDRPNSTRSPTARAAPKSCRARVSFRTTAGGLSARSRRVREAPGAEAQAHRLEIPGADHLHRRLGDVGGIARHRAAGHAELRAKLRRVGDREGDARRHPHRLDVRQTLEPRHRLDERRPGTACSRPGLRPTPRSHPRRPRAEVGVAGDGGDDVGRIVAAVGGHEPDEAAQEQPRPDEQQQVADIKNGQDRQQRHERAAARWPRPRTTWSDSIDRSGRNRGERWQGGEHGGDLPSLLSAAVNVKPRLSDPRGFSGCTDAQSKQRASRRGPGFSTGAPGPPFHRPGA